MIKHSFIYLNSVVKLLTVLIILGLVACGTAPQVEEDPHQPNMVLFFVDDLGWQDTSVPFWVKKTPFNQRYKTPNMERLAAEGMKFTQAYATPVCSPTRVSLLSGMNAAKHRVTNWTLYRDRTHDMELEHPDLVFPDWNVNGLSMDSTTRYAVHATPFTTILNEFGYKTIHVGKAHFGAIGTPGEDPLNLGFDVNIAGHAAGAPKSYYGEQNYGNIPGSESDPWPVPGLEKYHGTNVNLTEALTREALIAVDQSVERNEPFFLYMAHYTVHTPIMADPRFVSNYQASGIDSTEVAYATMVEGMDKSLGDILDYLEEKNLADETIILFMSDNGGLSAVERGGERHTHNKPLSSGKGSIHEGGIREPMIVKWPGITVAGSESDDYLIIEDFFPTILEMAGIKQYETRQEIDGISFVPMLEGKKNSLRERPLFWHYPNEWGPSGPGIGAFSAVRKGDWKLIYYHRNQQFELFNIAEDIEELANLANSNQDMLKALSAVLGNYLRDCQAQMPTNRQTMEVVPYPDEIII